MKDFKRLLELIRKTGDRCLIVSENLEDSLVVLPLETYEKLAKVSFGQKPEPQNSEETQIPISVGEEIKVIREPVDSESKNSPDSINQNYRSDRGLLEEEEKFYLEPLE
ncbi:MAG: hypothetical protein V1821_03705 [bacterium]